MKVPDHVREQIRTRLWTLAERIGWGHLSAIEKTRYYESWSSDLDIGGVLHAYMDARKVRTYLKDAVFKPYARARLGNYERCFRVLGISQESSAVVETYIKPHGRRLDDGRVVCWGRADAWKLVVTAVFERSYGHEGAKPFAAVLLGATGRFADAMTRNLVETASRKLDVERLVWLDT